MSANKQRQPNLFSEIGYYLVANKLTALLLFIILGLVIGGGAGHAFNSAAIDFTR